MMIADKTTESLKCVFTHEELWEKAKALSRETAALTEVENQKKEVTADFGARIASCRAKIAQLYTHINNGYEYRHVTCSVRLDTPEPGRKTLYRDDTYEEVRVLSMTSEEKQRALPFDNPPEKTSEEALAKHFGLDTVPAEVPAAEPSAAPDATEEASKEEPPMAFDADILAVEPAPEPAKAPKKTRKGFGGRGMIHG